MTWRALAASLLLAVAAGCGGGGASVDVAGAPERRPSGTLVLLPLREAALLEVDTRTGHTTRRAVPVGPGDALHHLTQTGARLVVYGGSVTYALAPDPRGDPTVVGESLYFVPSATDGRVWLAEHDPESPETVRNLRGVREVTLDGRVTGRSAGPPPCRGPTVVAAVEDAVLCQDGGLVVWEPVSDRVLRRLAGPYPVAAHGNVVAWCKEDCPVIHLTDVRSGAETIVHAGSSFAFEETYDGAFSPDGSLLALPVAVDGRPAASHGGSDGVALVDSRTGTVDLIEGSRSGTYTALAWAPAGDWLFFTDGEGGVMAYRPGAARPISLPVDVPAAVLGLVVR